MLVILAEWCHGACWCVIVVGMVSHTSLVFIVVDMTLFVWRAMLSWLVMLVIWHMIVDSRMVHAEMVRLVDVVFFCMVLGLSLLLDRAILMDFAHVIGHSVCMGLVEDGACVFGCNIHIMLGVFI